MALAAFREKLKECKLKQTLHETFKQKLKGTVRSLQTSADQLSQVGDNRDKLTTQFQRSWQQQEAQLATLDAEFIAAVIEQEDFNAMYYDPLTLLPRKAFYGKLLKMLEGKPLALVLTSADLDNFKLLNDCWSHAHGDSAIMQAADCIYEHCEAFNAGQSDVVCVPFRFGGDEFVMAFISHEGADFKQIKDCLEELRKTVVESLRKVFDFSRLKLKEKLVDREGNAITASGPAISIAASDPGSCSKSLWELHRLYVKADEHLNKAKPTFKQGEDPQGGVQVQADRIAGLSLDSFLKDLRNFAAGEAREKAAEALRNLATNADNEIAIAQAGAIFSLVELLSRGTPVGQAGAIPPLVELLSRGTPVGKRRVSTLGLTSNSNNDYAIPKAGAIPPLVELLSRGTPVGQENAAATLSNLANNDDNQIAIAKAGAIPPLVELLSRGAPRNQGWAAAALQHLAANYSDNKIAIAKERAAAALQNLEAKYSDNKIAIAKAGAIPPLVELLSRGTPVGQENAAAALGSLTNDDNQIAIAKAGAIPPLVELLSRGTPVGQENAAATLSNLAANSDNQIAVAKAGTIPPLVELLSRGTPVGQENAAAALGNLTNDDNQIAIAKAGAIPPLVELLSRGTPVGQERATKALWILTFYPEGLAAAKAAGALGPAAELSVHGTAEAQASAKKLASRLQPGR
ncbi:unnamed protein product [Effrenium voratum]|uniref:GGDEF domain-containing protein n=2 Tax=Effrenium voratum TaxID=2562239 RepID=A0AA36IQH9_9DINO|nr:unnamed protein product [Effrenium voratum]